MGAEPYKYIVDYEENIQKALDKLRERVFKSGDFHSLIDKPKTIEDAVIGADADGTRSILDINLISAEPDFCQAAPFKSENLLKYFGTEKPTLEMIENRDTFWENIERGHARYIILYEKDMPKKIFFAGYSFD